MSAVDLAAAYPWPTAGSWVRAMMVTTLDGAATGADGLSGSISSAGDQKVFGETRRLADVVLVGAGTVRAERYQPLRAESGTLDERLSLGLAVAPLLVIVSVSLQLPWTDPVIAESAVRPLIFTVENCDSTALAVAREHADVTVLPGRHVDPVAVLDHLTSLGLLRVVCEGGPHLLADLAHANVIDEADISIAPLIVGGGQKVTGNAMLEPNRFTLIHSIVDDGYLFNRYVRGDGAIDGG
jgi:riboflavin biosynthesis pyrimidine reductase